MSNVIVDLPGQKWQGSSAPFWQVVPQSALPTRPAQTFHAFSHPGKLQGTAARSDTRGRPRPDDPSDWFRGSIHAIQPHMQQHAPKSHLPLPAA